MQFSTSFYYSFLFTGKWCHMETLYDPTWAFPPEKKKGLLNHNFSNTLCCLVIPTAKNKVKIKCFLYCSNYAVLAPPCCGLLKYETKKDNMNYTQISSRRGSCSFNLPHLTSPSLYPAILHVHGEAHLYMLLRHAIRLGSERQINYFRNRWVLDV